MTVPKRVNKLSSKMTRGSKACSGNLRLGWNVLAQWPDTRQGFDPVTTIQLWEWFDGEQSTKAFGRWTSSSSTLGVRCWWCARRRRK